MRSSFALSASRTSIRFGGTDREAGQCRQYQLALEVSRRSGDAKLPSSWQGQQYPEIRPWSPALWADYEATTAQGPNVSSRRLRTGAADPKLPAGLLKSCPTLGQSSFGFHVYEAAVRGHREPASGGLSVMSVNGRSGPALDFPRHRDVQLSSAQITQRSVRSLTLPLESVPHSRVTN